MLILDSNNVFLMYMIWYILSGSFPVQWSIKYENEQECHPRTMRKIILNAMKVYPSINA